MIRKKALPSLLLIALLSVPCPVSWAGPEGGAGNGSAVPEGYRLFESTAAFVNGRILFRSDLLRESCLLRCAAFPGDLPADLSLEEVRERRIREILVLQEEAKLGLVSVDNAALQELSGSAEARMRTCAAPCARAIDSSAVNDFIRRRLVIREFLRKRVAVFVDVSEDDVRREIRRRVSRGERSRESASEETIREELFAGKEARAVRNWYDRVASKSKIVRSPLEEP